MEQSSKLKTTLAVLILGLFAVIVFGLIWFFFLGPDTPVGLGWYLFSFAAGLTMIILPCTLPLAFVIVPLSMGKGATKGLGIALSFGLGVALMLSVYGVAAALIGEVAIGTLGAPLEVVKNWLYFFAGTFAFLFALGEIGLVKFRMPTYSGAAPAFIQKQSDFLKAFLLGLFLGNVGVGCPHPATPVILTRIAASGDVFYGWLLFFTHAVGRVLPLLLLALLAILGVNALSWLVARKDKIERATGWGMVFVAGFILVLGLFSHDWWVYSGQHTLLEEITAEEKFLGIIIDRFNFAGVPHAHGVPTGNGLFGLPLWLGNWVLVTLWILPMWWYYIRKSQITKHKSQTNEWKPCEKETETATAPWRFWFFVTLSALLIITFVWYLPLRFLHNTTDGMPHDDAMMMQNGHTDEHDTAQYHEETDIREGVAVNLNVSPVPVAIGTTTRLDFFVNEKPGNTPVPSSSLEIEHEKLMHVIGVRSDLNEFFHIHPSPSQIFEENLGGQAPPKEGVFSISHTFAEPGLYKIWTEIKKDGVNHAFGHPEIRVAGEGETHKKEIIFNRAMILGNYQVLIDYAEPLVAGRENEITFEIHDALGREITVEPYLSADMHLSIIKDDLTQFIHTHPENHSDDGTMHSLVPANRTRNIFFSLITTAHANGGGHGDEEEAGHEETETAHGINFHVVFPEEGVYRAFAQFRPRGTDLPPDEALMASFWIRVEVRTPLYQSRGFLVTISLLAMTVLGWGVRKYLRVT